MTTRAAAPRARMTGEQRREQLIVIGRRLFAANGFEATTVEEIAASAKVSKPVVYEHFGGKEGLYAVVVDRAFAGLLGGIKTALASSEDPREVLEAAALAFLDFIEQEPDGFRILTRDTSPGQTTGSYPSLINDVAQQVQHILAAEFKARRLDPGLAPLYAQMLTGMVSVPGQWWLDSRRAKKEAVVRAMVDLAWYGLRGLGGPRARKRDSQPGTST